MSFLKWRSINKFTDIYKLAQRNGLDTVDFRSKIKLHGTNAGIRMQGGVPFFQKRSSDIDVHTDNMGFANFFSESGLKSTKHDCLVYGEWAGPGIQKTDAVSEIPQKTFFVFCVYIIDEDRFENEPTIIEEYVNEIFPVDMLRYVKVVPWFGPSLTVNFLDQTSCQNCIDALVQEVARIGEEDPYIKGLFNISGPGEGLVCYPVSGVPERFALDYLFKVKTDVHKVSKTKSNFVAAPKPEGVDEFIEEHFTENRMRQMLSEHLGGEADKRQTGAFLKSVMQDVHKETVNEIEQADFEWKDVAKYAPNHVKNWFFAECNKLA